MYAKRTHSWFLSLSLPPLPLYTTFSVSLTLSSLSTPLSLFLSLLVSEEWLSVLLLCSFGAWIRSVKCQTMGCLLFHGRNSTEVRPTQSTRGWIQSLPLPNGTLKTHRPQSFCGRHTTWNQYMYTMLKYTKFKDRPWIVKIFVKNKITLVGFMNDFHSVKLIWLLLAFLV